MDLDNLHRPYWKIVTPHERADSDLDALYGVRRYFLDKAKAAQRCQELNEAKDQLEELKGSFSFLKRMIKFGHFQDEAAKEELLEQVKNDLTNNEKGS